MFGDLSTRHSLWPGLNRNMSTMQAVAQVVGVLRHRGSRTIIIAQKATGGNETKAIGNLEF
jgi:hypothetical protein